MVNKFLSGKLGLNKKILIVEDHPVVMEGMVQLINSTDGFSVCAGTDRAIKVILLIKEHRPDLILIDLILQKTSGLDLIKDIKSVFPELCILVVSMRDETIYAERAIKAGAKGYIMKGEPTEEIIHAIKEVLKGRIYLSEKMKNRMMEKYMAGSDIITTPIDVLSDRELEVFRHIGMGLETTNIAVKMNLSSKTIETYYAKIKKKLCLKNFRELTRNAFEWNEKGMV